MLTAEEFNARMERIAELVATLAAKADDPTSIAAADLLREMSELHGAGLRRMLSLVNAGGEMSRSIQEKFAQDDLIRSMLLLHDLHPIDIQTRVSEAVENLRPVIESYGGRVSAATITHHEVTLRFDLPVSAGPSPISMLKDLLEQAILVVAPDVAGIRYIEHSAPLFDSTQLQILRGT